MSRVPTVSVVVRRLLSQPAHRLPSGLAVLVALACAVGLTVAVGGAGGAAARAGVTPVAPCGPSWVTAWQTAAQPAPAGRELEGATVRMLLRPQVGGVQVRVRFSNAYGATPLHLGAVTAARSAGGAELVPGTLRAVHFGGRPDVVVPAGTDVVSDPVALAVDAGRLLAVSAFLRAVPDVVAQHAVALQTSYLSRPGDATDSAAPAFPAEVRSWQVLTGVDVLAPRPVNALVAVGDSITDGLGSGPDADERWTDALSAALAERGGSAAMAVLNAGISGNRLLGDDAPLARFDRDVAAAAGVTDVVLHMGTNDIAAGSTAGEIVTGLARYAQRVRAGGRRVFLTTVTPSTLGRHGTRAARAVREEVNAWVRVHGREQADGVFDFAAAVADPADPERLLPAYDSGDGLHLSAAGYRALAAAVDATRLSGSGCVLDPRRP